MECDGGIQCLRRILLIDMICLTLCHHLISSIRPSIYRYYYYTHHFCIINFVLFNRINFENVPLCANCFCAVKTTAIHSHDKSFIIDGHLAIYFGAHSAHTAWSPNPFNLNKPIVNDRERARVFENLFWIGCVQFLVRSLSCALHWILEWVSNHNWMAQRTIPYWIRKFNE